MVERSFSLKSAVATAGNFCSSGKPFPGPEMRFAGSVEDGDSAIPVQLNFENPIRRVERLLYTVRHHAENERWEGFLGHFLRVKLGGKSSQFKIRLVRAQRENSAATLDCDDFAHCYWRNHIFPEPIHKSVHSPPAR
jgi:hypothetical protein